jgi:hypothetical protein
MQLVAERSKPAVSSWAFVLGVFAASRLFYVLAGLALVGVVPPEPFHRLTLDNPFGTLNPWAHYDGAHYVKLAAEGYEGNSPAFFPLYPLLVRLAATFFGAPTAAAVLSDVGVLVSLAALPFALWFVYRVAEDGWGQRAARASVLLLAFFPTAFFLHSAYTESLFLALAAGALWAARVRRSLLLACLLAGLATATRNVGVFLLVPLAAEWWRNRQAFGWRAVYLALAPSGLLAYAAYLWARFGDPLLFLSELARWDRGFGGVFGPFASAAALAVENVRPLLDPGTYRPLGVERLFVVFSGLNNLCNLLFLVFALAALALAAKKLPWHLTAYALALVLVPVFFGTESNPLMGLPRYVLVAFPLFIALGAWLGDRRVVWGLVALSAALSLPFVALFVNWYFVA